VLLDAWADQPELYLWYTAKAAENRWSVRHLQGQIALGLQERQGAAVTNFDAALEPVDADQALQATKDPYVFDFLELAEDAQERDLEQALIADIQKFLLELGTGIAVSTWKAGTPPPELPAVEITDEVPTDLGDLSELDTVRTRLIERVVRRTPEIGLLGVSRGLGSGAEFAGDEVDHRDVVAVCAVPAGSAFGCLDE
jgi:hypothetical protein